MKTRTNKRTTYKQKPYKGGAVLAQLIPRQGNTDEIRNLIIVANNAITAANNAIQPNMSDNQTEEALRLRGIANQLIEQVQGLRPFGHQLANPQGNPFGNFRQPLQHPPNRGGYYKRKTNKRRRTKRRYLRF
jgi:hypothetical protein